MQAPPQENNGSGNKLKTVISIIATVIAATMLVIVIVHALGGGWGPMNGTFVAYDGGFMFELTFSGREGFTVNITGEDPSSGTYKMEGNIIFFEIGDRTEIGIYTAEDPETDTQEMIVVVLDGETIVLKRR